MKRMIFLTAVVLLSQSVEAVSTPPPVTSKEDVIFAHKKDQKMLGFANASSFVGYYTRTAQSDQSLRQAELYSLESIKSLKMDQELCKQALAEIFGPLNEITLKAENINVWMSHTGKTCEASMMDPYAQSVIPERLVQIGFINAKPIALVFKLSKKSTAEQQANTRAFWGSLR